jgi:hypothetical protein
MNGKEDGLLKNYYRCALSNDRKALPLQEIKLNGFSNII